MYFRGTTASWSDELDDGTRLEAQALRIDYEVAAGKVVMIGDVLVDRGTDEIMGEEIRYDMPSGRLDAGGGEGRIRMRITPRSQPDEEGDGEP